VNRELERLITKRDEARAAFIHARFTRDAAVRYYDSLSPGDVACSRPAWDAFSSTQTEMDIAGDDLYLADAALIEFVLRDG
jgi:hypothetical protein